MSDLERLKLTIQRSSELSRQGQDEEALALLDDSLAQAARENRVMWIRILSHHAAVISESMGDHRRVRHYYEQSLVSNPNNRMALYGLAKALYRQGETELAKQYAAKCYQSIQDSESHLDRALLELVLDTWPELGQSHN